MHLHTYIQETSMKCVALTSDVHDTSSGTVRTLSVPSNIHEQM